MTADPRLIVALDVQSVGEADALIARLGDQVGVYKVGLELLATQGMALAKRLTGSGLSVFADWKLHDIGNQVHRATAAIAASEACALLTVHGEPQAMASAVKGRGSSPMKLLAVTVLTSLSDADLTEMGYGFSASALVERRVRQAVEAGFDGVISSPHEAAIARQIGGPDFLVVTPGVRPSGAALGDQARAAGPAEALRNGASHLVVGRPIIAAEDPRAAAEAIVAEMAGA
ncbi:MAG TPA: orotidine-5'-phosphate decarboxylase [Caulobacteraceae bacterium]